MRYILGALALVSIAVPAIAAPQLSGGYIQIFNAKSAAVVVDISDDTPDTLVSAKSPISPMVHFHSLETGPSGTKRYHSVASLSVPIHMDAHKNHIMLMMLKTPLHKGDVVPVTLSFENAGNITQNFTVK